MVSAEFSLSASNAALSGLLYDCCNSKSDQVGFLIGKMSQTMETVLNDSQEPSKKTCVSTNIFSTLPLSLFSFYNASGEVSDPQLNRLIGNSREQIVGWYTYRRNSVNSLCLRESLIDHQLRSILSDYNSKFFIVCLVSEYKDENNSTIEIQYTFYTRNGNNFVPVKVAVDNLAETGMDFKKSFSVVERYNLFNRISLDDAFKVRMPKFIEHAEEEIGSIFQHLSSELSSSEKEIVKLKNILLKLQPETVADCQLLQNDSSASIPGNSHATNDSVKYVESSSSVRKAPKEEYVPSKYRREPLNPGSQEF